MTSTLFNLGLGFTLLTLTYTAGANYYARTLSPAIIRRGPDKPAVALTFDDGPDPYYTPRLLEILASHGARATFFVLGQAAVQHPQLVRETVSAGNSVGIHTWKHRHPWLTPPWTAARDLTRCTDVLAHISGLKPRWFRPPWGYFSAATLTVPPILGHRTVLWSVTAEDWKRNTQPDTLADRVCPNLAPGGIVLLHDHTPAPGATEAMLLALPSIIKFCQSRGWKLVSLDEMFREE